MTNYRNAAAASLMAAGLLVLASAANAQSSTGTGSGTAGGSSRMWGAAGTSGSSLTDSSTMHTQDGNSAGQVNAAKLGLLLNGGPGITITSVGSQNIVNTSVVGNNNITSVSANQTSSNAGTVSNNGTVVITPP
jgi:hypothetical protein